MLKMQGLYPFRYQRIQELTPNDFPLRVQFCRWVLDHEFESNIIWAD